MLDARFVQGFPKSVRIACLVRVAPRLAPTLGLRGATIAAMNRPPHHHTSTPPTILPVPGQPTLKRELGPVLLTLYGLGTILGAGIYVVIGEVAGTAGLLTPFAFVLAALVASLTALSFSELTARIPAAGGPIDYAREAFGRRGLNIAI